MIRKNNLLSSKTIKAIGLKTLLLGWLLAASPHVLAQESGWSAPVMISTNTRSSWFSDVAVDPWGRPHVVWFSSRPDQDLLMYSTTDDQSWREPNDIVLTAYGGYTVRPAIAVDSAGTLHVTFRGTTTIYYTKSPTSEAWSATSWTPRRRISGAGAAYYSDIAVDEQGGIHVVWNESVSADVSESWLWFGTSKGSAVHDDVGWRSPKSGAGLSDRQIYAILEDNIGVQWFGTDDGVYRFDGHAWQKVGLAGQQVNCAIQDMDGRLWFGTDKGVSRYNEEDTNGGQWTTYTTSDGLPDGIVHAIATDRQGTMWIGTQKGLASYDGRNWTSYAYQGGLFATTIPAIAVDAPGNVWVGTKEGVIQYDGQNWRTFTLENGLLSNVITAIAIGRGGDIWFGTDKGLSRFDGQEWTSYGAGEGLTGNAVTALMADSRGTIWVGTEQGVSRYDGQIWEPFELPPGFAGQKVTAIAEDRRVNAACSLCADIFYRRSTDGGKSWSLPVNLSNTFTGSVKPQVRVGSKGHVYVTWEEGEDWYAHQGYPVASMYAHSSDGGNTWPQPTVFSSAGGAPQQVTLGVGHGGNLVAVWRLAEGDPFYYQSSTDHGDSWSQPQPIPGVIAKPWEHFNLDGYDAAADSAGRVHLVVLGRLSSPKEDLGLIHLVWNGSEWSPPTRIYASSDPPEWPRIDVGVGNLVHATWFTRDEMHITDSERGRYKVWESFYQADAPSQTPVPLPPTPTPASAALEQTTSTPDVTPTPTIAVDTSGLPPGLYTESDEVGLLLLALSPVAVVVLAIAGLRLGRLIRRR
jgi:ligand-binding sensor domain-containing protein